ncbi:MAG: hypothetical protein WDO16_16310 [Bacteroidota bacterium]
MRITVMNIARVFFITGFVSISIMKAQAQASETGNSHTLTIGTGMQLIKDELLPGSSERLTSTALAWSFSNSNAYRKKSILLSFEKSGGYSGKDQLRSNEWLLQYTNAFSVISNKSSKWNNYTGYSIIVSPQYIKSGDQNSWATINSLSLYNSLQYSWRENVISFDMSVPLAGLGSRPEANTTYKGSVTDMLYNSFSKLDFISLHNMKAINLSLQYKKAITGRLDVAAGFSYSYKDISLSHRFLQQAYGLHVGLSYSL